jgi:hypothetical protein
MNGKRASQDLLGLVVLLAWSRGLAESPSDGEARAVRDVAEREYELSIKDGVWQAPNRAQDLRVSFPERELRGR